MSEREILKDIREQPEVSAKHPDLILHIKGQESTAPPPQRCITENRHESRSTINTVSSLVYNLADTGHNHPVQIVLWSFLWDKNGFCPHLKSHPYLHFSPCCILFPSLPFFEEQFFD